MGSDLMHWTLDGEPFMNKRFHENFEVARRYGFTKHHFATNAMLLSLDRLRQLPSDGMSYVMTPDFCSDEAYFEEVRGTAGSWKIVLKNLIAAIEDPNLSHIEFKVTDISSYRFSDPDDLDRRFESLKKLFPTSQRVSFHRRVFHNASGKLDSRLSSKDGYRVCPYPWYSFFIAHNGDVVACCRDLEHQSVLGNLFEQDLMDIWNGEKYQAMRRDLATKHPERQAACDGCDMPYDAAKFSLRNFAKVALHRMLIFNR
jgi:radical SAM protein with 4Fe4S-binding SPASM domain